MLLLLFGVEEEDDDDEDDDLLLFSVFCDVINVFSFDFLSTLKFDKF